MDSLQSLIDAVRKFATDRDWKQFHSPKNLACALTVEAGELLEHFQWLTDAQSRELSPEKRSRVSDELADVFLYLLQLSDALSVDLLKAATQKIADNARRYPVEKASGSARKYTDL